MLDKFRFKIAAMFMKKAADLCETGEFDNIMKGLNFVKIAVSISPPSEEMEDFVQKLRNLVEKYS